MSLDLTDCTRMMSRTAAPSSDVTTPIRRGSTGSVYWEGLSTLHNASGQAVGSGYLEMTGYASALHL